MTSLTTLRAGLALDEPLVSALGGLRQRFLDVLSKYHLGVADLASAELHFAFKSDPRDDYACAVRAVLKSGRGRTYERVLL